MEEADRLEVSWEASRLSVCSFASLAICLGSRDVEVGSVFVGGLLSGLEVVCYFGFDVEVIEILIGSDWWRSWKLNLKSTRRQIFCVCGWCFPRGLLVHAWGFLGLLYRYLVSCDECKSALELNKTKKAFYSLLRLWLGFWSSGRKFGSELRIEELLASRGPRDVWPILPSCGALVAVVTCSSQSAVMNSKCTIKSAHLASSIFGKASSRSLWKYHQLCSGSSSRSGPSTPAKC